MLTKLERKYITDKYYSDEELLSSGIYMIKCLINNKVYIGQTKGINGFNGRWILHIWNCNKSNNKNIYLQNNFNKYELENFQFSIIEILAKDSNILNDRERYWISYYKSNIREFGMNLTSGGEGFENVFGEDNSKALLKNIDVENIKLKLIEGVSYSSLAKTYNVDDEIIREIKYCHGYKTIREDLNIQLKAIDKRARGENVGTSQLNNHQVYEIKESLSNGENVTSLAEKNNVSENAIYLIKALINWKNVGSEFNEKLKELKQKKVRLDIKSVNEIKDKFSTGLYNKAKLAKEYGVDPKTINNILTDKYKYAERIQAS